VRADQPKRTTICRPRLAVAFIRDQDRIVAELRVNFAAQFSARHRGENTEKQRQSIHRK